MKNPLKYYFCCRRSKLEEIIKELTGNINQLHIESGHHKKEIAFDADNENIVDMLYKLSDEVKGLSTGLDYAHMEQLNTEKDIVRLKEEAQNAKKRAEELEKQLEKIKADQKQQRDSEYKQVLEDMKKEVECEHDKRLKLIRSLVKFRDQLLIFKDNTEDEAAVKLLLNLYRETGRFMSENGIELLNRGGDFSTDYQTVVGTAATEQKELVNTIESTFRDGYIVDGKMLRPQEVVVYVDEVK